MPNTNTKKGEKKAAEPMDSLYGSDAFRMYCFKVLPCTKKHNHNWKTCPFAHEGEKARRRDPRVCRYVGIECPDGRDEGKGCPRGDECPFAHSVFEYWLHPTRYRTQMCNEPATCKRKVCFFAHSMEELREPSLEDSSTKVNETPLPKIRAEKSIESPKAKVAAIVHTPVSAVETSLITNENIKISQPELSGITASTGLIAPSTPPLSAAPLSEQFSFRQNRNSNHNPAANQLHSQISYGEQQQSQAKSVMNQYLIWQVLNMLNEQNPGASPTATAAAAAAAPPPPADAAMMPLTSLGFDLAGRVSPPSPIFHPPHVSVDMSSDSGSIYAGWNVTGNGNGNANVGSAQFFGEEMHPSVDILNHLAHARVGSRVSVDGGLGTPPGFELEDRYANRRVSADGYLFRDQTSIW